MDVNTKEGFYNQNCKKHFTKLQENIWNHTFLEHTNNQEGLVLWGRGKDGLQFLRVTLSVNLS